MAVDLTESLPGLGGASDKRLGPFCCYYPDGLSGVATPLTPLHPQECRGDPRPLQGPQLHSVGEDFLTRRI